MQIKKIHIYGYGKFENFQIENFTNLNILYGENEAGKSTIMAFIHSILFGFPTRQQTELRRYEPKFHSKYGGLVVINLKEIGSVTIERVKGKATGDVTVTMPDGTIGGEQLLVKLLHGIDQHIFRSIYSFNIHDIQNIDKISSNDLNRFLFSSSAIGTDKLMGIESNIQKELDELFRRRGKRPYLNVLLTETKEESSKLLKVKRENDTYFNLIEQKEQLTEKESQLHDDILKIREHITLLEKWQQMQPHLQQKISLNKTLNNLGEITFPADGVNKMKQLQQLLIPLETQIAGKEERLQILQAEINKNKPQKQVLKHEAEILWVNETIALYEKLNNEKREQANSIIRLEKEIDLLKDEYYVQTDNEKLLHLNTSLAVKNEVQAIDRKLQQLYFSKTEVNNRLDEIKSTLSKLATDESETAKQLLPVEERKKLAEQLTVATNIESKKAEYDDVLEKITLLEGQKKSLKHTEQKIKKQNQQTLLFALFFLIIVIVSFMSEQFIISAVSALGLIIVLIMRRSNTTEQTNNNIQTKIENYNSKLAQLKGEIAKANNVDISFIQEQLKHDDQINEQHKNLIFRIKQAKDDLELEQEVAENQQIEINRLEKQCSEFAFKWGVPANITKTHLLSVYEAIVNLKSHYRNLLEIKRQHESLDGQLTEIEETIYKLAEQCDVQQQSSIFQTAAQLKRLREQELEKQITFKEKSAKLLEIKTELKQLYVEKSRINSNITELLQHANVENLDQFYAKGEQALERQRAIEEMQYLERLIDSNVLEQIEYHFDNISPSAKDELNILNRKLKSITDQIVDVQKELASINHNINLLEEGGTHAQLLHQFKSKQAKLNEGAKDWARLAIAKHLLTETMNKYKRERLPKVLQTANKILIMITDGEYKKLTVNEDGFYVERNDNVLFKPAELSQATSEQVYVALRFALAITLGKYSNKYPIIIDDSFVNFDKTRVKQVLNLLNTISESHQVLFFTCHEHLIDNFQGDEIIYLS